MIWLAWDTDQTDVDLHVIEPDGTICATVNYILIETLAELPEGRLHQAGRMIDRFQRQDDGSLLLSSRIAVYDTLLVPNALVLPV